MKLVRKLLLATVVSACSSTILVQVPPRMLLDREQKIGIVSFDVQGREAGTPDVSSRFLEAIQESQPGVAVVELGNSADILSALGKAHLDSEAVREIGKKFDVDAVIVGALTLKESKPKVDVDLDRGLDLGSLQAQVRLDGSLEARLVNTGRGATLWTGSSSRWINLASVSGSSAGYGSISLPDRERQVEQLVHDIVQEASSDFRPTWERQPAP
jgi:hypothetical protein